MIKGSSKAKNLKLAEENEEIPMEGLTTSDEWNKILQQKMKHVDIQVNSNGHHSDASDSEDKCSVAATLVGNNKPLLSANEWALSLFSKPTTCVIDDHCVQFDKKDEALFSLDMIPTTYDFFEPFWRTESIENIEAANAIERSSLIASFTSKHKAATRALKKTTATKNVIQSL